MHRTLLTALVASLLGGCSLNTMGEGAAPGPDAAVGGSGGAGGDGAAPSCTDGVQNGYETDVDCGGSCSRCELGQHCKSHSDCVNEGCFGGLCYDAKACSNGQKDPGETDVDCGGTCPKCGAGKGCLNANDCESLVCLEAICQDSACDDHLLNGTESDLDCGGTCPPCGHGFKCNGNPDCQSNLCTAGVCVQSDCADGTKNGTESDIDCGGSCPRCTDGKTCTHSTDCESKSCVSGVCTSSCTDDIGNGTETDVDCGGSCPPCATGKQCLIGADCATGECLGLMCGAGESCTDMKLNQDETDIDCGGGCAKCADGKGCGKPEDCVSGVCTAEACAMASCSDTVVNGTESDVDCGGTCPTKCQAGQKCLISNDCGSRLCAAGVCVVPPSCKAGKLADSSLTSGLYPLLPPGASTVIEVYCDMALMGGGWTEFLQCLPSDNCQAGGKTAYSVDWLALDLSITALHSSFLIGKSLSTLLQQDGSFMLEVQNSTNSDIARVIYPLNASTRQFLGGSMHYSSSALDATVIDYNGTITQTSLFLCFAPDTPYYIRTFSGAAGLAFLGSMSAAPKPADALCDYGSWQAEMWIPDQSKYPGISTTLGLSAGYSSWASQPYAHRLFVREQ